MADLKYGHLYTEADVGLLMAMASRATARHTRDALVDAIADGEGVGTSAQFTGPQTGAEARAERAGLIAEARADGLLTFPHDEPLFLLRAQDKTALTAVVAYDSACIRAGVIPAHQAAITRSVKAFEDWRREHGTELPD